ncbi:MAG: histidine phosphatase family protein [Marmoricola sp.]
MRLLLLRHGETHANVSGELDTAPPGEDLTTLGRAQADAAATVLADREIEAVYVSTLVRTHQTAAPLLERLDLEPTVLEGLREISAGDLEMRSDDAARADYLRVVAAWLTGRHDAMLPGGETREGFLSRYDDAVDRIRATGAATAVIVSHGAAIRTWVGSRAVEDERDWSEVMREPLRNTGCIEVEEREDGWHIVAWQNHPVGGEALEDPAALDPTGRAPGR